MQTTYPYTDLEAWVRAQYRPEDRERLEITPFSYPTEVLPALAAGGQLTRVIQISNQADFIHLSTSGMFPTPGSDTVNTLQMTIVSTGMQFFQNPAMIINCCNVLNSLPNMITPHFPRLIPGNSGVNIQIASRSGSTLTVGSQIILEGVQVRMLSRTN